MILHEVGSPILSLACAPDGLLVIGTSDGRVAALSPFGELRTILSGASAITGVGALNDGTVLAAESAKVHIIPSAGATREITRSGIRSLALLNEGTVALGLDSGFELWSLESLQRREPHFREPHGVRVVTALNGLVAWSTGQRKVMVWNPQKADAISIPLKQTAFAIAFTPEGTHLAASQEWGVSLIEIARRHEVRSFQKHAGRVTALAFLRSGRSLASAGWDGAVKLWDVNSGTLTETYTAPLGRILALTFDDMNQRLAAAGDAGRVALWDVD